jgi:ubiquinone/menaquinone biosynthesis C-methylase UbiE
MSRLLRARLFEDKQQMPADWRLPLGVSRGLWDSCHSAEIARNYDHSLKGTPLLDIDLPFVRQHCQPPGHLLDLGCGTGRLAIFLSQHGYRPVGVDLSLEMLKVLREKANDVNIPALVANLADLCFADQSFDHAACLFGTLGLIVGDDARRRVIQSVHRVLRPGGVFVLHVHNRWFHLWTGHGRRLLCKEMLASWLGRGTSGDYEMPPQPSLGRATMHLFTQSEIVGLLRSAGFEIVEVRPLSLRHDGRLTCPWWFGRLRSYGYLIAARKPV